VSRVADYLAVDDPASQPTKLIDIVIDVEEEDIEDESNVPNFGNSN
jgi:hypothetical protein